MNRDPIRLMFTVLAACLAMTLAVLVRIPPSFSFKEMKHADSYVDKEGLPYFSQADAYYHIRMGDEIAEKGYFGTFTDQNETDTDESLSGENGNTDLSGERIDTLSFSPEGHAAVHQDGIVRVAIAVWRAAGSLTGKDISLHTIEFYLSCLFAALTALAVFLMGKRLSNTTGGLFAAVFAVCAPAFALRTAVGSFDTDMVQPFFTVLMIFMMMEAVCTRTIRYALLLALGAALSAEAYVQCWGSNAMAFVLIMFAGGGAALVVMWLEGRSVRRKGTYQNAGSRLLNMPGLIGYTLTLLISGALLLALHGSSLLGILMTTFQRVEKAAGGTEGVLPDLFRTISELKPLPFWPVTASSWLWGTEPSAGSVVNGIGGILVLLLVPAGAALLLVRAVKRHREPEGTSVNIWLAGLIMLVVWFIPCLYAIRLGSRFVEHLAIPAGILAGLAAGELVMIPLCLIRKRAYAFRILPLACSITGALVCAAALFFSVFSAWKWCETIIPSTCDAEESAMDWIAENASSPDAVIASWWDQGFFYEYESGHPVLWDGVTQDSIRALLLAKALITDNKTQSRNLLLMLSGTGNALFKEMRMELGPRKTFSAICTAATLDREEAHTYFREEWNLPDKEADRFAGMLYPEDECETYLVLTTGMMMRLGLIEYYAEWDFTGDQPLPVSTTYYSYPNGFGQIDMENETADPFVKRRKLETIWQLFFDRDGVYEDQVMFERVYEAVDGIEQVQVWRIVP